MNNKQEREKALKEIREARGQGIFQSFINFLEAEHMDALFNMKNAENDKILFNEQGRALGLSSILDTLKK